MKISVFLFTIVFLAGCTSSPLNRRQMVLFSEAEMAAQGERFYRQMQREMPVSTNALETSYVQCVANYIIQALDPEDRHGNDWEVTLFDRAEPNANVLPGGKISVYTGLLDVAINQHQLAAVMAHEVGHVLANHGNERMSQRTIQAVGVTLAQVLGVESSTIDAANQAAVLGLLLPYSRAHESEADSIGVVLMAKVGFDPKESITLWQRMETMAGPRPFEFMSTHPSPQTRIGDLTSLLSATEALRASANARGLKPDCVAPARRR